MLGEPSGLLAVNRSPGAGVHAVLEGHAALTHPVDPTGCEAHHGRYGARVAHFVPTTLNRPSARSAPRPPLLGLGCWSALQSKLTNMLFRIGRLSMMSMTVSWRRWLCLVTARCGVDRLHRRPGSLAVVPVAWASVTDGSRCPTARCRLPFDRTSRPRLGDRSPPRPTSAHVVAGATAIELTAADGNTASGTVVHLDPDLDLALVEIDHELGRPLAIGRADGATSERSS